MGLFWPLQGVRIDVRLEYQATRAVNFLLERRKDGEILLCEDRLLLRNLLVGGVSTGLERLVDEVDDQLDEGVLIQELLDHLCLH